MTDRLCLPLFRLLQVKLVVLQTQGSLPPRVPLARKPPVDDGVAFGVGRHRRNWGSGRYGRATVVVVKQKKTRPPSSFSSTVGKGRRNLFWFVVCLRPLLFCRVPPVCGTSRQKKNCFYCVVRVRLPSLGRAWVVSKNPSSSCWCISSV